MIDNDKDQLSAARGIAWALGISLVFWIGLAVLVFAFRH
jgi:hypothetical protein